MSSLLLLDFYCKAQRQLYPKIQATSCVDGGSCILPKTQYLSISTDTHTHTCCPQKSDMVQVSPSHWLFSWVLTSILTRKHPKVKWTNDINWQNNIRERLVSLWNWEKNTVKLLVFAVIAWYRVVKDIKKHIKHVLPQIWNWQSPYWRWMILECFFGWNVTCQCTAGITTYTTEIRYRSWGTASKDRLGIRI